MQRAILTLLCLLTLTFSLLTTTRPKQEKKFQTPIPQFFEADDPNIQYTGRVDFSNPKKPKFWAPGVYIQARFTGGFCEMVINDEELWGNSHNYLEVVVDGGPSSRVQTTSKSNTILIAKGLAPGTHTLTICKATEAGIGFLEFVGLRCAALAPPIPKPVRKLEFYGDSITCGMGSDSSRVACKAGQWYDQHNAYKSYGATTARLLNAQWQLTAVSGIGMVHSCCDMKQTMPDVWDKTNLRENTQPWNFKNYQPDAVMICLGQNDGVQNAEAFRQTYTEFIGKLRHIYPDAHIICLSSPMADANLQAFMKENLALIVAQMNEKGDPKVHRFIFSRQYSKGCDSHPDVAEHQLIAEELMPFLRTTLKW